MATNNLAEQSPQLNSDSRSASPRVLGVDLTVHKRHNSTRVRDVEAETSAIGTDVDLRYLLEENARQMLKYRKRPRLDHEQLVKLSNSFFNQDFPTRLWKIVDSDMFKSATWDKNGIYMLLDEERFTKEVLQRTGFRPTLPCVTMAGFDQQMILYGFQKLSSATPTSKLSMYYHHSFRQHQEKLLKKVKVPVVAEVEAVEEEDDVEIVMVTPGPPRQPDPPVTPISPPVTSKAETRDGEAEKDEKKEKERLSLAAKDLVAKISSEVNQRKTVLPVTPSSSHTPSTPTPAPASSPDPPFTLSYPSPAPPFTLSYPTPAPSCSYSNPSTPAQALTPYYTYSTPAPTTAPASSSPSPPTASVAGASSQTSRPTTTQEGNSGSSRSITPIARGWVRLNPNPFDRAPGPAGPAPGPPEATPDACPYHLAHSLVFTPSINHQLCIAKAQFEEANEAQAHQAHQSQAQALNAHLAQAQAQAHQAQAQQAQAQALNAHQAQSQQVQAQALYAQMAQAQMAWMQAAMYNPWVLQAMQMQMAAYMSPPPHYLHRPAGGFSTTHHINPVFPSGSSSPAGAGSESGRYSPDLSFSPSNPRTPLSLDPSIHPSIQLNQTLGRPMKYF
ncbi:pollen-specific leucine-rich repeat extensin-like protein 2 [Salmo salar]|uniref:Pollen-specific leucine-rich repeat extensin-like protein 2 n=1 Tax=Salmo salar TaxID=8030 RepID=A0A1S3SE38_SALSA|nr:pollen-specific leucine-rich repeat extensin-like protein 2 [Salmo salar]